jgi:hypothetical protein
MPGSLTTPGRPDARAVAPGHIAFHLMHGVGTQNKTLSRLNGWPVHSPVNASPRPSRTAAHDSGPMWIATPSSQGTCTLYSLPVSRRFAQRVRLTPIPDIGADIVFRRFGPSADLARQIKSLAHEDKTPPLRVAPWVACAPCGLERIG